MHAILVCENALQHPDATAWRMLSPLLVFSERLLLLMRSARERQVQHGLWFPVARTSAARFRVSIACLLHAEASRPQAGHEPRGGA